jgi:hypothetical protein
MNYRRAAVRTLAVVGALSGLGLLAGCGAGTNHTSSPSAGLVDLPPKQILAEARVAAKAAGSLHYASTAKSGSAHVVYGVDSSANSGRQVIKISGGGRATVLVVGGVGYIRANAAALARFFGFPDTIASRLAHRWISIRRGDPGYRQVVAGVTAGSVLDEATPVGRLTVTGPRTLSGRSVIGVRGEARAGAGMPAGTVVTIYIAASGRPLPVSCQEDLGSARVTVLFSRWGETVHVAAPRRAVPFPSGSGPSSA